MKTAPHGFTVNDDNLNGWLVDVMCRICNSPPGNLGNRAGRLAVYKPFTGSPRVLLITTQGRPTHLTCGQTVLRIIILRPGSWQKGQLPPLSGQKESLEATTQATIPLGSGSCAAACHGAFSIVARLDGNVPAWLVLPFQATGWTYFFFPFIP